MKNILSKNLYFIKIQKTRSLVRFDGKTVSFAFKDDKSFQVLKFESQISNFEQFEIILIDNLEKLNYRTRPWNRNALYFSIPNDLDEVQKRCYFDSADHVDATEVYLVRENIAILLNPQFQNLKNKRILIVGIFDSKVEFSIIRNLEFEKVKSYYCDSELLDVKVATMIFNNISRIRDNKVDEILVINDRNDNVFQELVKGFRSYDLIRYKDNLILAGLEIAAKENIGQVINRVIP